MELINNQVHLTDADLKYLVDNIDIDWEGDGKVVLKQGTWALTVTAKFYSYGYEDRGGSYGYDYERLWVHEYWEQPHDIDVEFYADIDDTDIEYYLEPTAMGEIEYAFECQRKWYN